MSEAQVTNVVVAGLGGQGVIKASDILADAAFRAGCDVKKAEIHGMSQRGGSVTTDVRFGIRVLSPMIAAGGADALVVLDPTQVDNNRHYLKPGGLLLTPDLLPETLLPNRKCLNVALLGALSSHLDLPETVWQAALAEALLPKLLDMNQKAFALGRSAGPAKQPA